MFGFLVLIFALYADIFGDFHYFVSCALFSCLFDENTEGRNAAMVTSELS